MKHYQLIFGRLEAGGRKLIECYQKKTNVIITVTENLVGLSPVPLWSKDKSAS